MKLFNLSMTISAVLFAAAPLFAQPVQKTTQVLLKQGLEKTGAQAADGLTMGAFRRQAQSTVELMGAAQKTDALDRLDALYESGEKLEKAFRREQAAQTARQHMTKMEDLQARYKHTSRRELFFAPITPTASRLLPPPPHPFQGQAYEFSKKYAQVMEEFAVLRKEYNAHVYYTPQDWHLYASAGEKRYWMSGAVQLRHRIKKLLTLAYSEDKPLQAAFQYVSRVMADVNPMYKDLLLQPLPPRAGRRFNQEEFLLEQPWYDMTVRMSWQVKPALPVHLKVAVVNDDPTALQLFRFWKQRGGAGEWEFAYFNTPEQFVREHLGGNSFDLLITDLTIPGSSVIGSVAKLREGGSRIPVIACSSYVASDINPQQMYNQGFDGYVSWSDVSAGGFSVLTDALTRYYFYRDYYQWPK